MTDQINTSEQTSGEIGVQPLVNLLSNPYSDGSDPLFWDEEIEILARLEDGQELVMDRHYLGSHDTYCVGWYWQDKGFTRQWDAPVVRLLGRQAIRPTQVAGGYSIMELTDQYKAAKSG